LQSRLTMSASLSPQTTLEKSMNPADGMTGSAVTLVLRVLFTTLAVGLMLTVAIVGLYLLKSAIGINILPGKSPLHALLYHFVR
jgi:hypothetical protein